MAAFSPIVPTAAASWPWLANMQCKSWDRLLDISTMLYVSAEDDAILQDAIAYFRTDSDAPPFNHQLASLLYFRTGEKLAEIDDLNRMTVAHLQHEVLRRGLLPSHALPETRQITLRVLLWMDNRSDPSFQEKSMPSPSPSIDDSGYQTGQDSTEESSSGSSGSEDSDMDDDGDDAPPSGNWKESGGYIRHWEPKLQRFVVYRY